MSNRILVVDDNPDVLHNMRAVLESGGFTVDTVSGGQEALDYLARQTPAAVLLDIMMPQVSGLDVLQRIRATPSIAKLPVVLLTALAANKDVIKGYQYAADYYLTKPCLPKQVLYAIRLVLGQADPTGSTNKTTT